MTTKQRLISVIGSALLLSCGGLDQPDTNGDGGSLPDADDLKHADGAGRAHWVPAGARTFSCNGGHTVTSLSAGGALVVGNCSLDGRSVNAAIYNVEADQWHQTEPLQPHWLHAAVRLQDGRVMISGGQEVAEAPSTITEFFDPATQTWTLGPALNSARAGHVALQLADGRLLVAGGSPWAELKMSEVYSPLDDSWVEGPVHSGAYLYAEATLLSSGQVLLVGETGSERLIPMGTPN